MTHSMNLTCIFHKGNDMSFVKFKSKLENKPVEASTTPVEDAPIMGSETPSIATETPENTVVEASESVTTLPDYETMSKAEIETFAREKFGVELDRRQSKNKMIEQLNKIAKGE